MEDGILEPVGKIAGTAAFAVRRRQLAQVKATTPVFFPPGKDDPIGWHDQDQWHAYGEWMFKNKLVSKQPRAESAFTNEFLPGQGLAKNTAEPGG